jgi:hypothetical protein
MFEHFTYSEVARYYLGSYLAGERNDAASVSIAFSQRANGPDGICP